KKKKLWNIQVGDLNTEEEETILRTMDSDKSSILTTKALTKIEDTVSTLKKGSNNNNNNDNNNSNSDRSKTTIKVRRSQDSNVSASNYAVVLLSLPNTRTHVFKMQASDTLWGLYGQVLRSFPEFAQKNIFFILQDGRKMQEQNFSHTLQNCACVPYGTIQLSFS
ncbi:hypothetical protein RFI_36794, partial [Reticulomyxa filosa]